MPYPPVLYNRYTTVPASAPPGPPLTGLLEWWKADAQSYSDGDPVGSLAPSAPGASTLTAMLLLRPTWKDAIINGLPVLRFVSPQGLAIMNLAVPIVQPDTVVWVMKQASSSDIWFDGGDGTARQIVARNQDNTFFFYAGSAPSGAATADLMWHTYRAEFNGASSKLYRDGTLIISGDVGANGLVGFTLGDRFGPSVPGLTGDLPELLIYNGLLPAPDVTTLAAYWLARYGLTGA